MLLGLWCCCRIHQPVVAIGSPGKCVRYLGPSDLGGGGLQSGTMNQEASLS